jgi:hypothetical protein
MMHPNTTLPSLAQQLVEAGHKVGVVKQTDTAGKAYITSTDPFLSVVTLLFASISLPPLSAFPSFVLRAASKAAGLTASGKSGTFARELAAVYTSATLLDDDILGAARPSSSFSAVPTGGSGGGGGGGGGRFPFFRKGSKRKATDLGEGDGDGGDDGDEDQANHGDDDNAPSAAADDDFEGGLEDFSSSSSSAAGVGASGGVELREQWLICIHEQNSSSSSKSQQSTPSKGFASSKPRPTSAVIALIAADLQAGRLLHATFTDDSRRSRLETTLRHLNPSELLLGSSSSSSSSTSSSSNLCVSSPTEGVIRSFVASAVDGELTTNQPVRQAGRQSTKIYPPVLPPSLGVQSIIQRRPAAPASFASRAALPIASTLPPLAAPCDASSTGTAPPEPVLPWMDCSPLWTCPLRASAA